MLQKHIWQFSSTKNLALFMVVRNHINVLKVWYLESHIQMYIFSLVLHLDGIHLTPHRNFAHLRIEHSSTSSYEYILTEFPRSGEELTQCHSSITPISYTKSQFIASVVKQHHSIWQPSLWNITTLFSSQSTKSSFCSKLFDV